MMHALARAWKALAGVALLAFAVWLGSLSAAPAAVALVVFVAFLLLFLWATNEFYDDPHDHLRY